MTLGGESIIDGSAVSEYYRPAGAKQVQEAVAAAIAADLVAVNGSIQAEIVAFASEESADEELTFDFKSFHWLDLDRTVFDSAAEIGFSLRRKGVTIPATDLIIAASTIAAGAISYHVDSPYDLISRHPNLVANNLQEERAKRAATGSR